MVLLPVLVAVTAPLLPTGRWSLWHDDRVCEISRQFGPSGQASLLIERRLVDRGWTVRIATREPLPESAAGPLQVELAPGKVVQVPSNLIEPPSPFRGALSLTIANRSMDDAADDAVFTITAGEDVIARFSLTGARSAMSALESCRSELLAQVGLQPESIESVHLPMFSSGRGSYGYPADALKRKAEGDTIATARIGAAGELLKCRVIISAGDSSLDGAACKALRANLRVGPWSYRAKETPRAVVAEVQWRIED